MYSSDDYGSFTIANGSDYLQIQTRPNNNTAEISIMKNGTVQSFSTTLKLIGKDHAIRKDLLIDYFKKVWCEDYYLDNISNVMQKDLIEMINQDIENMN